MNTERKRKHDPDVLAQFAPQLLTKPLDYVLTDHQRQRELFALCVIGSGKLTHVISGAIVSQ